MEELLLRRILERLDDIEKKLDYLNNPSAQISVEKKVEILLAAKKQGKAAVKAAAAQINGG